MIRWLKEMLLPNILLVPPMVAFPAICWALAMRPDPNTYAAMGLLVLGALSAALYVLLYSQLSIAPWQRGAEAVRQWRREQGGFLVTTLRATGWMVFGLFGSVAAETAYCLAFAHVPGCEHMLRAWIALLPLAVLSPLFLCWLWRRIHA